MVKQRFWTHFKPWLFAVCKVGGVIVGYQVFDQARMYFHYAPVNIANVVMAATVALFVIGLFCVIWAWGEWCWFRLRSFRGFVSRAQAGIRQPPTTTSSGNRTKRNRNDGLTKHQLG